MANKEGDGPRGSESSAMMLVRAVSGMDASSPSADAHHADGQEAAGTSPDPLQERGYGSSSPLKIPRISGGPSCIKSSSPSFFKPFDDIFDKVSDFLGGSKFSNLHQIRNPAELAHELGKPGVDPDVHDKHCNAPVHSIVKRKMKGKKKIALLEVLFTCSCANIDLQGPNGYTALHFAAEMGDIHAVMALLAFGAEVNVLNTYHKTPFDLVPYITRFVYRQESTPSLVMIKMAESDGSSSNSNSSSDEDESQLTHNKEAIVGTTKASIIPFVEDITQLFERMGGYRGDQVQFIKKRVTVPPFVDLLGEHFGEKESDAEAQQTCIKAGTAADDWPAKLTSQYRALDRSIQQRLQNIEVPLAIYPDEAMSLAIQLREMTMYKKAGSRMLFLDGGGIRGLIQIEVLRQIEVETGRKITELFDWIVGSSTGAVVALALVYAKKSVNDLRKLYFRMKNEIFGSAQFGLAYNTSALESILKEELGECTMDDVKHPRTVVLAVNKDTTMLKLHYFNNCFGDEYSKQPVWKVARYSSAAPMYFNEFEGYVDAGVLANNPCESGLTRIQQFYRRHNKKLPISLVVSIGTGTYLGEELGNIDVRDFLFPGKHWLNIRDWLTSRAQNFLTLLTTALGESETIAANCESRCFEQGIFYYRFNPRLPEDISPGETSTEKLVDMIVRTRSCISNDKSFSGLILRLHELAHANYKMYCRFT